VVAEGEAKRARRRRNESERGRAQGQAKTVGGGKTGCQLHLESMQKWVAGALCFTRPLDPPAHEMERNAQVFGIARGRKSRFGTMEGG
jgi:hypothetical protein